jgi:hypothetical protein
MNASKVSLVIANLVPVAGVLLLGWDAGLLVILYWIENIIIGIYNVFKMLLMPPPEGESKAPKIFIAPFFAVHYGGFCLGHGVFVFFLASGFSERSLLSEAVVLLVPAAGLMVSHGISFYQHYLMGGEREKATLEKLMLAPYKRIVLLHVGILIGAVPVMALRSPMPLLLFLIVGKIVIDLKMHKKAHEAGGDGKGDEEAEGGGARRR